MAELGVASATSSKPSRADRVLRGVLHFARGDVFCELPSVVARYLGESVDTVQRGLRDLAADGRLELTPLRAGKARAYRLVESPPGSDASPQPAALEPHRSRTVGTAAAVAQQRRNDRVSRPGSPAAQEDLDWHENWVWNPELLADYADRARAVYERLTFGNYEPQAPAGAGPCDDCKQDAPHRERLGRFDVCLGCLCRRHAARLQLAAEVAQAQVDWAIEMRTVALAQAAIERDPEEVAA